MENLPNSTLLESLLDELIENVKTYNPDGVDLIIKAYKYAAFLHDGIFRESGEPYVSHTLCVAIILSELKLDTNVICAGLLHDAIEDTDTNKDKIAELFNEDIAYLVDGVTKIRKGNFASKDEKNCANLRKLLEYAALDIRVILIKLADRLHNMRTLAHKKDQLKRIENSQETLEVYVPISYHLGLHPIKSELENLALEFTAPSEYKTISEIREDLEKKYAAELEDLLETIKLILENIDPNAEIKTRIKSIYGIYKELYLNKEEPDLHDLFSAKIVLDNNVNCYQALGLIHSIYPPQRGLFKDYIASPKPNGYSGLHTTLYVEGGTLLQTQICTKDMNYKNQHGITTNIEQHKNDDKEYMKEELRKWYSFYRNLESIVAEFQGNDDNKAFMEEIKKRVLAEMVYVRQQNGEIIELPKGTNKREFATLIGAPTTDDILVNGRGVTDEHRFKNFETVLLVPTASLYNLRQNPSTNQEEVLNLSLSQSKYKSF